MLNNPEIVQQSFSGKATHLILFLVLICAVTTAVIYKGANASITHDESSTYLNLVDGSALNLWSCYSNPECWTTANNHLLNTLFIRWSVYAFGPTEFSLRLPNLILFLVYIGCVICLLCTSARNFALGFCGLTLFLCNPFVLDYFALARGYGMGLGFMLLSMTAVWMYYLRGKPGYCILAFLAATGAVFANLTYVAYAVALTGALIVSWIVMMTRRPEKQISVLEPLSALVFLLFGAIYFYRPVLILIGLGEFEYGAPSLWDSWNGFTRDSLYGTRWYTTNSGYFISVGAALLVVLSMGVAWLPLREAENKPLVLFGRFVSLLCIILITFFVANHLCTGAAYPSEAKSIIYFPGCALMVYLMLSRITPMQGWRQLLIIASGVILLTHLAFAYNANTFRQWWYDTDTRDMAMYVANKGQGGSRISLAVEWIFHPSTHFYIQTRQLPIDLAAYSRETSLIDSVDYYYYFHPPHAPKFDSIYTQEHSFNGRTLLRHVQ